MYTSLGPGAIGVDRPFPEVAELAAEYGFDAVQLDLGYLREEGPEAYRAVLDEHGLRTGSMGLPLRFDADEAEYEAGLDRLEEAAALADAVGCERASTYVLPFSDERDFEANFAFHRERLEPVADALADHGIRLGLEFVGPATARQGHEYEFVHTTAGMLDLCDAVGENVGLLLDSWHWYTAGDDAETLRGLSAADVVDVHVNDAPDRPREEQVDSERRLPAETGVVDVETFLGELDRTGYDGPVMVEPFSDEVEAMADEDAVAATADALAAAWERAGL